LFRTTFPTGQQQNDSSETRGYPVRKADASAGQLETTIRHEEIVNRLKQIKEELLAMKEAFEALEASK